MWMIERRSKVVKGCWKAYVPAFLGKELKPDAQKYIGLLDSFGSGDYEYRFKIYTPED